MARTTKSQLEDSPPEVEDLRRVFGGVKHARFHDPQTVYHGLIRTVQGRYLLRPDDKSQLVRLIAGVIGRAQELYPAVRLYADAWLSNHAHLLLRGPAGQLSAFVGFVDREISRRWGGAIGWDGAMFQKFETTALPTEDSQHRAFAYVLAQSAKEHLVDSPLQWPGAHCAKDLTRGLQRRGIWFEGTRYGKELHKRRARKRRRSPPARRDYERPSIVRFDKLPVLGDLPDEDYRTHVVGLVRQIEEEAAAERQRTGRKVFGRKAVLRVSREKRRALPPPPWFERRRRMICWADPSAARTRDYLRRYWDFQERFHEASRGLLAGALDVVFPPGAFRPSTFVGPSPAPA